jgi:hypothetical protein
MNDKLIFIASSLESKHYAEVIGTFLRSQGSTPLIWDDPDVFSLGGLTFECIENVANQVHGAVIIASPDIHAKSERGTEVIPRPNVLLELGFFVGRLSRKQIAFCVFDGVSKPSDLKDFTHLPLGRFVPEKELNEAVGVRLSSNSKSILGNWVKRLDVTRKPEARIVKCHGYSGLWEMKMTLPTWRQIPIKEPDQVVIIGHTLFHIPQDGNRGCGAFYGTVHVSLQKTKERECCDRSFRVVDRIDNVTVGNDGALTFTSETVSRELLGAGKGRVPAKGLSSHSAAPWTYDWHLFPSASGEWPFEGTFKMKGSPLESWGEIHLRRNDHVSH